MIKTFENFNELDPYGEEDWENELREKDTTIGDVIEATDNLAELWNDGETHFDGQYIPSVIKHFEDMLVQHMKGFARGRGINYVRKYEKIYGGLKESVNELDPYGEENWNDDLTKEIETGYYHIIMIDDHTIDLSFGYYDDDDPLADDMGYILLSKEEFDVEKDEELWVDILSLHGDNAYVSMDVYGKDYVGTGYLPKNKFEIV